MQQVDGYSFLIELMDLVPHLYRQLFQSVQRPEVSSLPATQLRALFILTKNGTQSMSALAEALSIPRQQLTKVVHALVEKRLVRRKTNPSNRRMIMIEVSAKGEKLMRAILESNVEQCLSNFQSLTPEQMHTLQEAMEIVRSTLIPALSEQEPT